MKAVLALAALIAFSIDPAFAQPLTTPAQGAGNEGINSPMSNQDHPESTTDSAGNSGRLIERICGNRQNSRAAQWGGRLSEHLSLNDSQRELLKDLQDTRQKARDDSKSALCSSRPDMSSLTGRLAFREKLLEMRLATMKATRPKLEAFYNSLDDKQKASLREMRERGSRARS